MTTALPYYQFPKNITKRAQQELTGNQFKVLSAIIEEIMEWPEYRKNFTKELSCRYLSSILKIHYSHISKAIKKLEELNFIKVLKKGTKSTGGSIIKLLVSKVADTATKEYSLVADAATTVQEPDLKKSIPIPPKAVEESKKILQKIKNPQAEEKEFNRIVTVIKEKLHTIQNPAAYLVSSCRAAAERKFKDLQNYVRVEKGKEEVRRVLAEQEVTQAEELKEVDWLKRAEELEKAYPVEFRQVKGEVEKENRGNSKWAFTWAKVKAEMFCRRFEGI